MKKLMALVFLSLLSVNSYAGTSLYSDTYTEEEWDGNWKFDTSIDLKENSADVDTPNTDRIKIYAKDDGAGVTRVYTRASDGTVSVLGSSSTSGISPASSLGLSLAISGDKTGSNTVVFNDSPTFLNQIEAPKIVGGQGTTSTITIQPTSGVGATGASIVFKVGNNGSTEAMRILNNGNVGIGTSSPQYALDVTGQIHASGNGGILFSNNSGIHSGTATGDTLTIAGYNTNTATNTTLALITSGNPPTMNLAQTVTVTDDPYDASGWNASSQIPTKNAIRDKIESILNNSGTQYQLGYYATSGTTLSGTTGLTFGSPTLALSVSSAVLQVTGTQASSSTGGAELHLRSNDGAVMAMGDQLGVLKFSGAEDGSGTIQNSAAIAAYADGVWSAGVNPTNIKFYTANTNTRILALTIESDQNAVFENKVTVGSGLSSLARSQQTGDFLAVASGTSGGIIVEDVASSSSSAGPTINLYSNDGAAMASGDRLGRITFGGPETTSTLQNAVQIAAFADGAWSAGTNPSRLELATQQTGSRVTAATITSTQAIKIASTLTSERTTDFGWTVVSGANTACNNTCTSACVVGIDTGSTTNSLLACTDATSDVCLCAGPS